MRVTKMDERWVSDLLAAIDNKDAETFMGFLTPDARFHFGNATAGGGA
jgi:hypothetical protein